MSPLTAAPTENSPLLQDRVINYNKVYIEDDDNDGNISVVTTDSPSAKSSDSHDEVLLRRLNGAPLMVLLIG
jgi:hypothetical protein